MSLSLGTKEGIFADGITLAASLAITVCRSQLESHGRLNYFTQNFLNTSLIMIFSFLNIRQTGEQYLNTETFREDFIMRAIGVKRPPFTDVTSSDIQYPRNVASFESAEVSKLELSDCLMSHCCGHIFLN